MSYQNLLVLREDPIAIVQLNRPKVLNALNRALMQELVEALQQLDQDEAIRCLIVTGDRRPLRQAPTSGKWLKPGRLKCCNETPSVSGTGFKPSQNPSLRPSAVTRWEAAANWLCCAT